MLHFLSLVAHVRKRTDNELGAAIGRHRQTILRLKSGADPGPQGPRIVRQLAHELDVDPQVFTAEQISITRDGHIEVLR